MSLEDGIREWTLDRDVFRILREKSSLCLRLSVVCLLFQYWIVKGLNTSYFFNVDCWRLLREIFRGFVGVGANSCIWSTELRLPTSLVIVGSSSINQYNQSWNNSQYLGKYCPQVSSSSVFYEEFYGEFVTFFPTLWRFLRDLFLLRGNSFQLHGLFLLFPVSWHGDTPGFERNFFGECDGSKETNWENSS